jgi:hypothetical protein
MPGKIDQLKGQEQVVVQDSDNPTENEAEKQGQQTELPENKIELSDYQKKVFELLQNFVDKYRDKFNDNALEKEIEFLTTHKSEDLYALFINCETEEDIAKIEKLFMEIIEKFKKNIDLAKVFLRQDIIQLLDEMEKDDLLYISMHDRLKNDFGSLWIKSPKDSIMDNMKYLFAKKREHHQNISESAIYNILDLLEQEKLFFKHLVSCFKNLENLLKNKEVVIGDNSGDVAYGEKSFRYTKANRFIDGEIEKNLKIDDIDGSLSKMGLLQLSVDVKNYLEELKKCNTPDSEILIEVKEFIQEKAWPLIDNLKEPWEKELDQLPE